MPSRRPIDRYNDIIYNVDAIGRYTAGMDQDQYLADEKTKDATVACLLRISEASIKLGRLAEKLAPEQRWAEIRAIGNKLRHEYDIIDATILWRIIARDLPSLRKACEQSVARLHRGLD